MSDDIHVQKRYRARLFLPARRRSRARNRGPIIQSQSASALLALDYQLFLWARISQEQFNAMGKDALLTSWGFWELAHDEYGM